MQHNQEALLYSFFFQDKGMRQIRVTNIIIYVEQRLLSLSYQRINNTRNEGRIEETRTGWDTVVHFSLTETHDTVRSRRVIFLMKKTTKKRHTNKQKTTASTSAQGWGYFSTHCYCFNLPELENCNVREGRLRYPLRQVNQGTLRHTFLSVAHFK